MERQKCAQPLLRATDGARQRHFAQIVRKYAGNVIEIGGYHRLLRLGHLHRIGDARLEALPGQGERLARNLLVIARHIELVGRGAKIQKRIAHIGLDPAAHIFQFRVRGGYFDFFSGNGVDCFGPSPGPSSSKSLEAYFTDRVRLQMLVWYSPSGCDAYTMSSAPSFRSSDENPQQPPASSIARISKVRPTSPFQTRIVRKTAIRPVSLPSDARFNRRA